MRKFPETKDFAYWAIGLISLLIYFMTLKLTKNSEVVDYISFGGTLIGILLAVIAIIYAYQQGNQSAQSYSETKALLSVISHNVKDIDKIKTDIALSHENLKEIKTLASKFPGENFYTGDGKKNVNNLSKQKAEELKGFLDFQVLTTPREYNFYNPQKIDSEKLNEFIKLYVGHYTKISGDNSAIAFNVGVADNYYGINFNLSVADTSMTPNRLKAILESVSNDEMEIFTVARLIFAD